MYENFEIEGRGVKLVGYHFPVENAKKVVVLIHGIGEHDGRYNRVSEYFAKEGIAMVGMDLRGHGLSEGVRGDCSPRTEVLKDIDTLIETAKKMYPGVPCVLYGHSMGGGLVLDYRARGGLADKVDGYLISAPWIKLVRNVSGGLLTMVRILSKLMPKFKIKSECAEEDLGNPDFVRPYVDDPMVHPFITMRTSLDGFSIGRAIENGTNEDNLKTVGIPCLHMHGSDDKICYVNGSRNFSKLPRNANDSAYHFVELPGYYHEIHNGGPGLTGEEAIKKAIEFIKSL